MEEKVIIKVIGRSRVKTNSILIYKFPCVEGIYLFIHLNQRNVDNRILFPMKIFFSSHASAQERSVL